MSIYAEINANLSQAKIEAAARVANLDDLYKQVELLTARETALKADHDESLDTIWMLLAALLVFFMHAGFSLLETGCVRQKNTQNILTKNLIVVTCGFIVWFFVGYPIAIGDSPDPNMMGGSGAFATMGFWENKANFRVWFFQGAFCATGGTIVSGAMAERVKLTGFIIFTCIMTGIIYPVVAYWGWSGTGILNYEDYTKSIVGPGLLDFAGSGIVHMTGGVAALVGAAIVGPRAGRFDPNTDENFEPHNIPFCVLGTFALWFGWYGFNPGSTLAMHDKASAYSAGLVAVNTTLAPCGAGLVVFALRAFVVAPKRLDVGGFCNGILAGLVAITAGCAFVRPWEALLIGIIGGFVYQGSSMLVQKLKIDDVVDAFSVHGATGFWGLLALGFFGNPADGIGGNGIFYGGEGCGGTFGTQLVAGILIAAWAGLLSAIVFFPLKLANVLRLSDEFQKAGADALEHSPPKAYAVSKLDEANTQVDETAKV
jgi:Amt family ammonium transporter